MIGRAWRNVGDVVDEDHALLDEPVDDDLVVDDLVVAVDGRLEGAHHPRQRLDRHLHAGAEATWLGQEHGRRRSHVHASAGYPTGHAAGSLEQPCPHRWSSASRPGPPAERAGLCAGDEVRDASTGIVPRDVIEWQLRGRRARRRARAAARRPESSLEITKRAGEPLGAEVSSAVFDRVRTCDNHCEFCFIYQLPTGMRRSLYLKDDDYRLSFLYGNFTTLTRFTEADLERVVTERLSPLNVSIHATDPDVRARMLKNPRGGMSLRWLRALLDHGIAVHGQVVLCPGVNDGEVLRRTMAGVLDEYPELESVAVVPLGSQPLQQRVGDAAAHAGEARGDGRRDRGLAGRLPAHALGRRMVFAADEYYLMAGRPFPAADTYEGFSMHEDGIGMARTFEMEFNGRAADADRAAERLLRRRRRPPPNPAAYTGLRARVCAQRCAPLRAAAPGATRPSASSPASSAPG